MNHDYYSYYIYVKKYILEDGGHFETPYLWIIENTSRNYLLFRTAVWGSALYLFYRGAYFARINTYHSLFILAAGFIITFCYGRVTLAMSMVFTGYIIFYNNKSRNLPKALLGIIVFLCAFFFHKSIVFAMFMAVVMTIIPINKKTIPFFILGIPIFVILVKTVFLHILVSGEGLNERAAKSVAMYGKLEREPTTFFGMIYNFFDYGRFYIPLIVCAWAIYFKNGQKKASIISIKLLNIALGLAFCSVCISFIDLKNEVFIYRILYMSMIPLIYCIVDFYEKDIIPFRQFKRCVLFLIIANLYSFTYSVYMLIK